MPRTLCRTSQLVHFNIYFYHPLFILENVDIFRQENNISLLQNMYNSMNMYNSRLPIALFSILLSLMVYIFKWCYIVFKINKNDFGTLKTLVSES